MTRVVTDRIDALLWFAFPALLLLTIPIGVVSNDGLGVSQYLASGRWQLNPNHVLFEPLGAWWLAHLGSAAREPVDTLKWLSGLAGALAVAFFRFGVARHLAVTRSAANHATAWMALSSAFLRLWISDEVHMIQMPFVVAMAWAALRYLGDPSVAGAVILGVAVGLAALAFISNLVLGLALAGGLAARHLTRREPRVLMRGVAAIALGTTLTAGPVLLAAWLTVAEARGFLVWLTHYGGGIHGTRIEAAYGLAGSLERLGESAVRTVYGAASALVDLVPIAAAVRDRQVPSPAAIAGALACLAASAVLLRGFLRTWRERDRPAARGALLLTLSLGAGVLGFGLYWNNSDDQFYFQLAPVFGALAARSTGRRGAVSVLVVAASVAGLSWNVADVGARYVLYPRQERMMLLEHEVRGACLAVYPGFDEPERLLAMSRAASAIDRVSVTDVAVRYPVEDGLRLLTGRIGRCLAAGGRVALVDMLDTPAERSPWKFLRRLGYDRATVEGALAALPLEPRARRVGPFTIRTTR